MESRTQARTTIRAWCRHSNTEDQIPDLIATVSHIETMWLEWRRTLQTGVKVRQQRSLSLYRKTKVFRVYNPTVVWGSLQTAEYAAELFRQVVDFFEIPEDIDAGEKGVAAAGDDLSGIKAGS